MSRGTDRRVAVWLHDGTTADKVSQTLLELVRAGISELPLDVTVLAACDEPLDATLIGRLPFPVVPVPVAGGAVAARERLEERRSRLPGAVRIVGDVHR